MRAALFALPLALLPAAVQDTPDDQEKRPTIPEVGKPAPTFRLNDHTGKGVAVGGKSETWTVIAFFPKAMTPG